jgi:hypothetical protein
MGDNNHKIWLASAEEIGKALGCSRYQVPRLVSREDLPAFKFFGRWTALPSDLQKWCTSQRTKHLKHLRKGK